MDLRSPSKEQISDFFHLFHGKNPQPGNIDETLQQTGLLMTDQSDAEVSTVS